MSEGEQLYCDFFAEACNDDEKQLGLDADADAGGGGGPSDEFYGGRRADRRAAAAAQRGPSAGASRFRSVWDDSDDSDGYGYDSDAYGYGYSDDYSNDSDDGW